MKTPVIAGVICTSLFLLGSGESRGAEVLAAQALLDRIAAERGETAARTNVTDTRASALKQSITNLMQTRAQLAPGDAAARWIELLGKAEELAQDRTARGAKVGLAEAFSALPEPAAWPALKKTIDARESKTANDLILKVIAGRLVNDFAHASAAVEAAAKKQDSPEYYVAEGLKDALNRRKEQTREGLLKQLDTMVKASSRGELRETQLPALRPTLSEEEAIEALKKALPQIKAAVSPPWEGDRDYMWKAALAVVDQLPIAQWSLVLSPSASPLYEALEKKFPSDDAEEAEDKAERSYLRDAARRNYLVALLQKGEIEKALGIARKMRSDSLYFSTRHEQLSAENLTEFYLAYLKENPSSKEWSALAAAAAQANATPKVVALVEELLKKPDLAEKERAQLKALLAGAKLADDRVDEALAMLPEGGSGDDESALGLAFLGAALKKPELLQRAVTIATKALDGRDAQGGYGSYFGAEANLPVFLARHGMAAEGLELAAKGLSRSPGRAATWLQAIGAIYIEQGRPADALVLLERSPDWGIDDVAKTLKPRHSMPHGYRVESLEIGYIAAAGLAAAGRTQDALKVLRAYLATEAGDDRAYELLLKIAPADAEKILDEMYKVDRFEERPLIWKAVLQQRANQLELAEKTIRDAIAIDPSDGEQGPPDRLRAYAVLADIRAARGDAREAEFLRNAVKSIRLSEEADLDFAAGLHRRAINKYRESLKLFADAYCVQARLAVQMAAIGMNAEAEEHYRRAFELMPDSFGRVESHCFGCEGAFGGEKAQGVAEKVFAQLVQKTPEKPQLHYLLGYLRNQQERYAEAATHLKEAVRRDPDYLNAWKLLAQLSQHVKMTPAEEDEAALNSLRLDPAGRHGGGASRVSDLARLWETVKVIAERIPDVPTEVLRLPASAEQIAKQQGDRAARFSEFHDYSGTRSSVSKNPATMVMRDEIIQTAIQMAATASRYN